MRIEIELKEEKDANAGEVEDRADRRDMLIERADVLIADHLHRILENGGFACNPSVDIRIRVADLEDMVNVLMLFEGKHTLEIDELRHRVDVLYEALSESGVGVGPEGVERMVEPFTFDEFLEIYRNELRSREFAYTSGDLFARMNATCTRLLEESEALDKTDIVSAESIRARERHRKAVNLRRDIVFFRFRKASDLAIRDVMAGNPKADAVVPEDLRGFYDSAYDSIVAALAVSDGGEGAGI